ncbi:MAG: bifunctional phosphoribosylaminoimidazolecarboxamide formyltransferase/IMP cyclohydrolase, partial [Chloroflexota bacterium]|nr:bifunctional phosphoribosylaminoimidazolecarboxamide formyltransferase/IMP cyclohydrolase [Chloroflexota bacterium]
MRALLSVANREGIAAFARNLRALDVEIVATDGTREFLAGEGIDAVSVSDLTAAPPLVGGQVKTFHPAIYAGILARRDQPEQLRELEAQGIGLIDLVVVNVKPFAPAVGVRLVAIDEAIEMIEVGGASLLGAAARNAAGVTAVADPAHYALVVDEIRSRGAVSPESRARLAAEAFSTVAAYHAEIAAYLNQIAGDTFPSRLAIVLEKVEDLRYGENPHQRGAFYRETTHRSGTLADSTQLQGGRPSFNNLLDLDAAYRIARDYTAPTVAIVKHTDPVGLASHDELVEAYRHALDTDPVASFGGIVGVNRELDGATAREIAANSYEAVVAPGFSEAAIGILRAKAGLEVLAVPPDPTDGMRDYGIANLDFKRVAGGLLVESLDELGLDRGRLQVVTQRRPTLEELTDLLFAWRAVRHVRSNAIVLARHGATI